LQGPKDKEKDTVKDKAKEREGTMTTNRKLYTLDDIKELIVKDYVNSPEDVKIYDLSTLKLESNGMDYEVEGDSYLFQIDFED